jgi:hypothetical protein
MMSERERQDRVRRLRFQQRPLIEALSQVGIEVRSVWDLVNTSRPYPAAIPVLVEHLRRPYDQRIKEGITRALTVPAARELAPPHVMSEFLEAVDVRSAETTDGFISGYKWALANTLYHIATEAIADDLIAAIHDPRHHVEERRVLVGALGRCWRLPRALQALRDLTTDPELGEAAHKTLRRFRKA